jgi:hypothetical protein
MSLFFGQKTGMETRSIKLNLIDSSKDTSVSETREPVVKNPQKGPLALFMDFLLVGGDLV